MQRESEIKRGRRKRLEARAVGHVGCIKSQLDRWLAGEPIKAGRTPGLPANELTGGSRMGKDSALDAAYSPASKAA